MPLKEVGQFTVSYLQILDEDGNVDTKLDPGLSAEELVEMYRWMALAREADQRMLKLQRQGRMGTFPLCTGQEAAAVGSAAAMAEQDWFVGSYRELGGRLMRGDSLLSYYMYWNGYEEGNRQPEKRRVLPIAAIVGSHVPHAVGVAYAMRYGREEDAAVLTYFGDGATSQGDVHEAMNFAGVWKAPVVFICMNNQWAISQPVERQTASQTIAQKAVAHGFEGIQVDGNDALAVYRATQAALERARSGGGPTLIEALTYRLMMHTTADDPRRYRSEEDVEAWWSKDPLKRLRRYMEQKEIWNEDKQAALDAEIKSEVDRTVKEYEGVSGVKPDAPFDHIYGQAFFDIERQRDRFVAELEAGQQGERSHG